jgi:hypothetical protein
MIVAVHQPQYLPWLGYFHKMDQADVFVLLDNVQYKKNEWQNRNRIKTAQGWQWLTVPVHYKFPEKINEVKINNQVNWQHKQQRAIISNYSRAPFFKAYQDLLAELFGRHWSYLVEVNIFTIKELARLLNIDTPIKVASELGDFPEEPNQRLIQIVRKLGGDCYLAGEGGQQYMDLAEYRRAGIEVIFQRFQHPTYRQLFSTGFEPRLSVIDLLFNHGPESINIIRGR